MNRQQIISHFQSVGVLGKNCKTRKNVEEFISESDMRLLKYTTSYLPDDVSVYERLLNLRLGIVEELLCEQCGTGLAGRIYWSQRRYHRFCNTGCRVQFSTNKRVERLMDSDAALAKQIAKKATATQIKRGTLTKRIKQSLETKRKSGQCTPEHLVGEFAAYKSKVYSVTRKQPLELLENIELRGAIEKGGWHIDHKFSIRRGFLENVPPELVGHFCNLQVIPGKLNVSKQDKCSIELVELKRLIERFQNRQLEFRATAYDHRPSDR